VIYLYGIVTTDTPLPAEGHAGAALETLVHDGLAAVVSRHTDLDLRPDPELLWRHEAVVEEVMEAAGTVVPARFGSTFDRDAALIEQLARHAGPLRASLERTRDAVEIGLRVLWDPGPDTGRPPAAGAATSGREYLLARAGSERRRQARRERAATLAGSIHDPLAARSREATLELLVTDRIPVTGAYLVDSSEVGSFREDVERLAGRAPGVDVICTGPWPPYSFVPDLAPALLDV
jgi:hypothetical protein